MRLLFDHNVPAPLRRLMPGYDTSFADECSWSEQKNGDLLAAAAAGFDVLLTAGRNLRHQQNLSGRHIGLVVLSTNHWPTLRDNAPQILVAVEGAGRGQYIEVELPRPTPLRRTSPTGNGWCGPRGKVWPARASRRSWSFPALAFDLPAQDRLAFPRFVPHISA